MSSPSSIKKIILLLMTLAVVAVVGLLAWNAVGHPFPTAKTSTVMPTDSPATTSTTATASTPATTSTTAAAVTTTAVPSPSVTLPATTAATTAINSGAYSAYNNTNTSWWFNHPAQLGKDMPSTINAGIAALVDRYRGIWRQATTEKVVYLTMDEGYERNDNTTRILGIAAQKGIKITFFITGDYLEYKPSSGPTGVDLVRRMRSEGHLTASHTWSHPNQATMIDTEGVQAMVNDMQRLDRLYSDLFGTPIARYLRPPQGAYSERTLKVLSDLGYRAVFWSFAYRDWITTEQPNPEQALAQIVGELHPGAVYLLHAVSDTNVQILPGFIDAALARGYRFDTIDKIP